MEKDCGFYTKGATFAWNTAVMASNPLYSFKVTCEMCSYDSFKLLLPSIYYHWCE